MLLSLFSLDHSIPLGHPTAVFTNYCQKIRGYRKGGSYDSEIGEIKFSGVPEKYTCVLENGHCCEYGRYQFQILSVRGGGPFHRSSEYQAKAQIMTCGRVVGRLRYVIGNTDKVVSGPPTRRAWQFYTGQQGEYPDPPWSGMKPTTRETNH